MKISKNKYIILLGFLLFVNPAQIIAQATDTLFLLKSNENGVAHTIFIDNNPASRAYEAISDFQFNEFDTQSFAYSSAYLKENNLPLSQRTIEGLPLQWSPVYEYQTQFYAYYPSDFYTHQLFSITDTAFIDYTGEGAIINQIADFKRLDERTFRFELKGIFARNRTLLIHIVDAERGLAVFEELNAAPSPSYFFLMADAEKIRDFPIVVNHCETEKQLEFEFDLPDFEELMNGK